MMCEQTKITINGKGLTFEEFEERVLRSIRDALESNPIKFDPKQSQEKTDDE